MVFLFFKDDDEQLRRRVICKLSLESYRTRLGSLIHIRFFFVLSVASCRFSYSRISSVVNISRRHLKKTREMRTSAELDDDDLEDTTQWKKGFSLLVSRRGKETKTKNEEKKTENEKTREERVHFPPKNAAFDGGAHSILVVLQSYDDDVVVEGSRDEMEEDDDKKYSLRA